MAELTLPTPQRINVPLLLDIIERAVLLALFTRMLLINLPVLGKPDHWYNALLLISEGMVVVLLMVRRNSQDVSMSSRDWLFAFFATVGPLLVRPEGGAPLIPGELGFALLCAGLFTQISAKLVLGRSFGIVPANRGIKVEGPYRFVRHPMYLGYITVQVTFLVMAPNGWNLLVYGASFTVQLLRILAEERLLSRDPAYAAFMGKTRWRLMPGVF